MQLVQQESVIRERAYAIWEQEGRPDGREWDHWVRAAREITEAPAVQIAAPAEAAPRKKGRTPRARRK